MSNSPVDVRLSNQRALVAIVAAGTALLAAYLLRDVAHVLLLAFAGILLAVFLHGLATWLSQRLRLPRSVALGLALVVVLGALVAAIWLVGPEIADQVSQLLERIPSAVRAIRAAILHQPWGRLLLSSAPAPRDILPLDTAMLGNITGAFSTAAGILTYAVVTAFIGVYLAVDPETYINGTLRLFPRHRRARAREVLRALGQALHWWLVGRMASMAAVGFLTWLGLLLVGVPLALALGLIAGLLSFVPFLGPVVAAVPAVLVGLVEGPTQALYVIVVYSVVQSLESYLITPMIQERAVSVPPAIPIGAQILMGVLFGLVGLLLATPLAVAVTVLVQMLYVEDVLGDTVKVLGE